MRSLIVDNNEYVSECSDRNDYLYFLFRILRLIGTEEYAYFDRSK